MSGDDWKGRLPNRVARADERAVDSDESAKPYRGGWLDILALIIATYQIMALPLLLLFGAIGLVIALFLLVFR